MTEPHDLWTSRAPQEWVDRVPQAHEVKGRNAATLYRIPVHDAA